MPPSTAVRPKPPRPVFRRSRLGCKTCKRRKKKCPQQYNEDGVCERCELGGFECEPGSSRGPLRSSVASSQNSPPPATSSPTPAPNPQPQPPPFYQQQSMSLTGSAFAIQPSYTCPTPAFTSLQHSPYANDYPYSSGYAAPSSLVVTQSFGPAAPSSFAPFADLSYSASLLEMLDSLPPTMSAPGYYSPWTEISQSLLGLGFVQGGRPKGEADLRSFILKELAEGEDLTSVEAETEISLTADLYCDIDDEWLKVWQPYQRHLVKEVMYGTITSSPTSRAACLAVAAGLRARLLHPSDSRKQEVIQRSDSYYNQAMQMLVSAPFEVQAGTLFDLMIYQTDQHGAAAGYAVQELMDALVVSHPQLGPHPIPFIHGAPGHVNFVLQGFFVTDVLRSFALHRRTLFDITSAASLPAFTLIDGVIIDKDKELMQGVATEFFFFIARMCNLAMDEQEGLVDSTGLKSSAEQLEREIVEWRSSDSSLQGKSEEERLECAATQEMWRHALLISLRQDLYHRGSLHSSIRSSLDSILTFGGSPSPPFRADTSSLLAANSSFLGRGVAWFMAATVATCKHDREVIRRAFGAKSPFFGVDNLPIAERIWAATDEAGRPQDWREVLRNEGVSMMFM